MYLLDTDIFSNLVDISRSPLVLRQRIALEPVGNLHLSVILVEEYLQRILPDINRYHATDKVIQVYGALGAFLHEVSRFSILPFDEAAYAQYLQIPDKIRQSHRRDCRVAAIAATRGYTVITRNTRDFEKIAIASCEDWMIEASAEKE